MASAEKFCRLLVECAEQHLPVVCFISAGGMQTKEGAGALFSMAAVNDRVTRFVRDNDLPVIVFGYGDCTGGACWQGQCVPPCDQDMRVQDHQCVPCPDGTHNLQLWEDGIVPYEFDPAVGPADRAKFVAGLGDLSEVADLIFVERTDETDYVFVTFSTTPGVSFSSSIGMARR